MDLILERFLDEGYAHLSTRERHVFDALLDEPDQLIYAWVLGRAAPERSDFRKLVTIIRAAALGTP